MPFLRALTTMEERLNGASVQWQGRAQSLRLPPDWNDDSVLWARVVAQARLYAQCKPAYFRTEGCDVLIARLFDDLATTADLINRGGALGSVRLWLKEPHIRHHEDARSLRNLVAIMDALDVF